VIVVLFSPAKIMQKNKVRVGDGLISPRHWMSLRRPGWQLDASAEEVDAWLGLCL
jgi:hypothetical protein